MSALNTVSGNAPVIAPIPEESQTEETAGETTQNIYNIDNTQICELLTQLIEEVKKSNETNNKIYETMLINHAEYLQGHADSMEFLKEELVKETESETETETETYEDFIQEQILSIGESLEKINITVSGNNTLLTGINDTTTDLSQAYTEHAETQKETDTQSLALEIGGIFILALIAGLIIAKIAWGRMK